MLNVFNLFLLLFVLKVLFQYDEERISIKTNNITIIRFKYLSLHIIRIHKLVWLKMIAA